MIGKYEILEESKKYDGRILHRIKSICSFTLVNGKHVDKGELGGWVERETNLSQADNCWIYDDAMVYGYAEVYYDAIIYGNARVYGNAWIYNEAQVYDNAQVYGWTRVTDTAKIYGNSLVGRKQGSQQTIYIGYTLYKQSTKNDIGNSIIVASYTNGKEYQDQYGFISNEFI